MLRKKSRAIRIVNKEDQENPQSQESRGTEPVSKKEAIRLDLIEGNKRAKVIDIQGGWGVKRRLSQIGIHPGDVITVVRYGPLGGPMVIEVHGFQLALGRGVASQILVEEMSE